MRQHRFNLVIENLIFSSQLGNTSQRASKAFQSRNRESYLFKTHTCELRPGFFLQFQSRNRESYSFQVTCLPLPKKAKNLVSIS